MHRASIEQLVRAIKIVGAVVGRSEARYCFEGRLAIELAAGWSLVLSPDDAERLRFDACHLGRIRATMWCLADDLDRLAELAATVEAEAAALAA